MRLTLRYLFICLYPLPISILSKKREDSNFYLSTEKYNKCVENVLKFKGKESKQRAVCKLLKKYDFVKIMSHNQLIVTFKPSETKIVYFVKNEDLFDIIHDAHIKTDHGEQIHVISELHTKYKNITYKSVTLFLSL